MSEDELLSYLLKDDFTPLTTALNAKDDKEDEQGQ